jgi:signal transduction histidine kinase
MNADSSDPQGVLSAELSREILSLYREARAGLDTDFKHAAMTRARRLLPISASSWVNGVLGENGPVILEASSIDLKPGFWEAMEPFMVSGEDPLGPMMYASPGRSFVTEPDFFPPAMQELAHRAFDVHSALTGLSLDPHTGIFSAVCWHRNARLPVFTEAERLMHEQLLPHWLEGLALHRVLGAAKAAALVWRPGLTIAVVDRTGLIHHAQAGFGELLKEECPDWRGAALPATVVDALHRQGKFNGATVRAAWWPTAGSGLMVIEMSHRHAATTAAISRDLRSSVLDASLQSTERQLGMVSSALAEQQRRQAVIDERHRIMRELHDGVGSHLVGLLNLAHRGTLEPGAMEEAVREALDEMRIAVDSMQSSDVDIVTALADLRYRMQPRFDAAGIAIHWELPADMTPAAALAPGDVFQWQRILLEAFTNILRHSRAKTTRVSARAIVRAGGPGVDVAITDDGTGLGNGQGHGLRNMSHRARAIGASLAFERHEPSGTVVRLWWPLTPPRGADDVVAPSWHQATAEVDSDFGRLA